MTHLHAPEGFGGYAETARYLSDQFSCNVSRQQVYMWHLRRDTNGFPKPQLIDGTDGSQLSLFNLADVQAWLTSYWATRLKAKEAAGSQDLLAS